MNHSTILIEMKTFGFNRNENSVVDTNGRYGVVPVLVMLGVNVFGLLVNVLD